MVPQLPGYRDFSPLGRGGYSEVYRAYQGQFDRWVAVKLLTFALTDERSQRRFLRECRLAGRLSGHPNIVTVYDAGIAPDGRPFISMELFDEGSLATKMQSDTPLHVADVVRLGILVAGALETAHRAGVVHRDVKPGNILLTSYGQPMLGDFGLSVVSERQEISTNTNAFTPYHVAPELLEQSAITPVSDVYSLASTIYAMLAGRAPHQGEAQDSIAALLLRVLQTEAPHLGRTDLPSSLSNAIHAGLRRDPNERIQSALLFAQALQQAQVDIGDAAVTEPVVVDLGSPGGAGPGAIDPPSPSPDLPGPLSPPSPAAPFVTQAPPQPQPSSTGQGRPFQPHFDSGSPDGAVSVTVGRGGLDQPVPPAPLGPPGPAPGPAPPPAPTPPGETSFHPNFESQPAPGEMTVHREPAPARPDSLTPSEAKGSSKAVPALVGGGLLVAGLGVAAVMTMAQGDDGNKPKPAASVDVRAPTGLEVVSASDAGVELTWDGPERGKYVVMVMSEKQEPRTEGAMEGPSKRLTALDPEDRYCFAVANFDEVAELPEDEQQQAFSSPKCIRGASETSIIRD